MKKIILLLLCLFICGCSTTKTLINYKGDGLLKEYKVKEHKEVKKDFSNLFPILKYYVKAAKKDNESTGVGVGAYILSNLLFGIPLAIDIVSTPFLLVYDSIAVKDKHYDYNVYAKITGKIVNIDNTPISNQNINIQFGNEGDICSNINGLFERIIKDSYSNFKNKKQYYTDEFILNFNNGKSEQDIEKLFQNGKDLSINNPHKIYIKLDTEKEHSLYLEENDLKEKETIRSKNKDVIILSSQTFSAKYYRDKIEETKENIKKKLKQNNINYITAEEIMLNSNGTLRDNWQNILNAFVAAEKRIQEVKIENVNRREIILTNKELNNDWKYNLEDRIQTVAGNQAKIKLEKQTGYTYYDSDVKQIICEEEYTDYGKNKIRKVKNNWEELVNEEIKKQKQKQQKKKAEIEAFKHDPDLHTVQSQINRCPKCYRFSLIVSLLMRTGDPYHQWILFGCTECGYVEQKFNGF